MKRKLISFDAFKKIEEQSLTNAETELIGVEDVLAKTLGIDDLKLFTFGENDVTYQSTDGTYIHATYKMDKDNLILENIEQLVIDEATERKRNRDVLSSMVDSLLEGNDAKATQQFEQYLLTPSVRRELLNGNESLTEGKATASKPSGKLSPLARKHQKRGDVAKRIRSRMKTMRKLSQGQKAQRARERNLARKRLGGSTGPKRGLYGGKRVVLRSVKEWSTLSENVLGYIDYKEFGPMINESMVRQDDNGNVTSVAIPTQHKRNEGKILSFNWKTLDTELKYVRGNVKKLAENQTFVKAMADLKRYNNISDNTALEETLEAIVSRWPDVLYITESELAQQIATALETANVQNYDDQSCAFMAEAILRTAHHAYTDRVRKVSNLAGSATDVTAECKECEDAYTEFRQIADPFFIKLDESNDADLKVFADLFKTLQEVRKVAVETDDNLTKSEVESFMDHCAAILNQETEIDLNLAETIANYLQDIVEANVSGSSEDWDVSNSDVHHTVNGDNPRMGWIANQTDATPSKYTGDWGDEAPVSDGKSYKNGLADEMRNRSWSNHGGDSVFPDLKNPYVPQPFGDYKMKEPSAVDDGDNDWSRFQSSSTWPNLNNPYVPDSPWDKSKYKMKSDNLVVDKGETKV